MSPEGVMDQEYTYTELLVGAAKVSRDGDRLTIEDGAGEAVLVLQLMSEE